MSWQEANIALREPAGGSREDLPQIQQQHEVALQKIDTLSRKVTLLQGENAEIRGRAAMQTSSATGLMQWSLYNLPLEMHQLHPN